MGDSAVETEMEVTSVSSSYSSSVQMESVSESQMTIETGPVDENANAIEDANVIEASVANGSAEISQDNIKIQLQEIISEIEQNVEPEEEEVTKEQEDAVKSLVEQELKLMQEEEAMLASIPYEDDGQPYHHTWKPKGKYDTIKTEVKHEDISAIKVNDPKLTELQKAAAPEPQTEVAQAPQPQQNGIPVDMQPLINGYGDDEMAELKNLDIPAGIPLLARILPKDAAEIASHDKKISLERLFTPATDSPDLTPTRNKKIFASSDFYRPDHPTIEDQRDLAQRISNSLIVADNKMSRGQTMYIKRQERSTKWTGQEKGVEYGSEQYGHHMEVSETDYVQRKDSGPSMPVSVPVLERPTLKTAEERDQMRLNMKQVDPVHQAPEAESPAGKGAALFAKRKKRMDKYIVDETTVQQSGSFSQQQSSVLSSSTMQSSTVTDNQQFMVGGASTGPTNITYGTQGAADGSDVIYTAECKVVQRSHPPTPQFELPPSAGPLMELYTDDKREKRKSFNLAAKGFGTYNDFYKPIHLGKAF